MSAFRIRHLEPRDAADLQDLASDPSVYGNTLQLPFPSAATMAARMDKLLCDGRYQLVCETAEGRVVGSAGLWRLSESRLDHIAGFGINVHRDWQGRGVGKLLTAALLDLADNCLGLERIELMVYADNLRAQALYRRFGFVEEARLRAHSFRAGAYHDTLLMGRLRHDVRG
ncbi:GNAT family N-acetyltransferase [Chromobacterium alticapitis]|uniref:GNAT family N-acetyltransferase n=1 Tax=Chromobacterium alticapitis TaxID=2073169 RepID=A0A2S5DLU1_9NEIS|nr:GNAT family N-acetyltransferase [Chromobacterium alticapitis]POZ64002.1 GNAT family N-acetyltransferase [Chromobacterium alticapitis]